MGLFRLSLGPLFAALAAGLAQPQDSFVNWETPHVHPLELSADGAQLYAVNLPDNRLEVFWATASGPLHTASIPVGLDPVSVRARTATEVWVVNHVSDSVSVIDLTTRNVIRTLATDDEPADVVFAGTPERAFVSCSQENTVLVFDPADLTSAPTRIEIRGEDPRALAVSPDGGSVYLAVFESGNQTTVLGGGLDDSTGTLAFPPNVVSDPAGPYGGVNPPPNDGIEFVPAQKPGNPPPPRVSLIVRRDANGVWRDDNGTDWSALVDGPQAALSGRPVGWVLLDHDLCVIDTATLAVSYVDHLMNLNMALAVHPVSGEVAVVGTDATNEIRFEPNLNGTFVRSHLALVDPAAPTTPTVLDLNDHLTYQVSTVAQSERDRTLADPRGAAWNAAGTKLFVSGLGSNNVVVYDATGARAGLQPTIEVGEGPTGLVVDDARGLLYVLNKFDASISVVDLGSELETQRVPFYDPTPEAIQVGRKHLYDAHETSGLGLTACAACHVDARMDRLGWDLGDPSGDMKTVIGQNLGGNVLGLNTGFEDFHPMKGPMLTQTMQDIIGLEPHHWRGDRDGIEEFDGAFLHLLGDDETLDAVEMQEFEDFLATIHFPPNPFRRLDNELFRSMEIPGHHEPGKFGTPGTPLPTANANAGLRIYTPPRALDMGFLPCATCHTLPVGVGTNMELVGGTYVDIPTGPNGEKHHALVSIDGATNVSMKIPHLRNLYERTGFDLTQPESTAGFGYFHDGSVDTIERFLTEPAFSLATQQELADLTAFMLSFAGSDLPVGSPTELLEPPGPPSQDTHAMVGVQVTVRDGSTVSASALALIDDMIERAEAGAIGVVVKGRLDGEARGWAYRKDQFFQSDRRNQKHTRAQLIALAGPGSELTFTVVPRGSQNRIGLDRDEDRAFDRDELDANKDPADPTSKPKVRRL